MKKTKSNTDLKNNKPESMDDTIALENQKAMNENLAIGYAKALRGEGISSDELKNRLKKKALKLREKHS